MNKKPRNYDLPREDFNENSGSDFTYENEHLYPEDTLDEGFDLIQSSTSNLQDQQDPELFD